MFKRSSPATFYSVTSCYSSDTISHRFHSIKNNDTLTLNLRPALGDIDFKVVDIEDKQPLPDSDLVLSVEQMVRRIHSKARQI